MALGLAGMAAAAALTLPGCEEGGGYTEHRERAKVDPSQPTGPGVGQSQSALGKARDSAVRVGDQVADHNRELEEAADSIGKD